MKLTLESTDTFAKALQKVTGIIGTRSTLPILANVLLEAEDDNLTLTTTDLEIRIMTTIKASIERPGKTTLPGKKLHALVNTFDPASSLVLDCNERHHTTLQCGHATCTLLGLSEEDFPLPVDLTPIRTFKLRESEMARILDQISYAVSMDDSRKVLHGVLLSVKENNFTAVATDGKRLALVEKTIDEVTGEDGEAILPLRSANMLKSLMEKDGEVTVEVGENQISFKTSTSELNSKLIEGTYPNYRQVIPTSFTKTISVPTSEFLSAIKTPSTFTTDTGSFIRITFGDNKLQFYGGSDTGEASNYMDIEYDDQELTISFNPNFLETPFSKMTSDVATVKLNDAFSPVGIEGGEGFLYVIMPMRNK